MAAKKPKRKKGRGDSPINVGGGGGRRVGRRRSPFYMELIFDHSAYVPNPKDQDSFINPKLLLDSVRINDAPPTSGNPPVVVPVDEGSEILIKYKRSGSLSPKITVNGGPFGVSFKPTHIPYDFDKEEHYAEGVQLKEVTIDKKTINIRTGPGSTNTIVAHTKDKPKRKKRRAVR